MCVCVCVKEISCVFKSTFLYGRNTKKEKETSFSESCYRSQSQRLQFKLLNNKENPSSALCHSSVLPLLKNQRTYLYMSRLWREDCSQKSGMWLSLRGGSLAFPSSDLTSQGSRNLGPRTALVPVAPRRPGHRPLYLSIRLLYLQLGSSKPD